MNKSLIGALTDTITVPAGAVNDAVIIPRVEVDEAVVVWVPTTTVAAERDRLGRQLAQHRAVFGIYGERYRASATGTDAVTATLEELRGLDGRATLIATPVEFRATRAPELLPRGARIVGWLDVTGYHARIGLPQPTAQWLTDEAATRAAGNDNGSDDTADRGTWSPVRTPGDRYLVA